VISAFSFREIHEQGREMVRGDIDSIVCDRRFWLPILAVRVHGSVDGAIFTGAAGANL